PALHTVESRAPAKVALASDGVGSAEENAQKTLAVAAALEKATGRPAADVLKNVQAAAPSVAPAVEAQAKSPPPANLGASIWAALRAMVGGKPKAEGSTGISTIEFALSVLRHHKNPVEFFDEMHAKHGVSMTVDVPGRGRFMVDD